MESPQENPKKLEKIPVIGDDGVVIGLADDEKEFKEMYKKYCEDKRESA